MNFKTNPHNITQSKTDFPSENISLQERFHRSAMLFVNRANWLTRWGKYFYHVNPDRHLKQSAISYINIFVQQYQAEEVLIELTGKYFRLWKYEPETIGNSEFLLDSSLIDTLEFDNDIFAAGGLNHFHHWPHHQPNF